MKLRNDDGGETAHLNCKSTAVTDIIFLFDVTIPAGAIITSAHLNTMSIKSTKSMNISTRISTLAHYFEIDNVDKYIKNTPNEFDGAASSDIEFKRTGDLETNLTELILGKSWSFDISNVIPYMMKDGPLFEGSILVVLTASSKGESIDSCLEFSDDFATLSLNLQPKGMTYFNISSDIRVGANNIGGIIFGPWVYLMWSIVNTHMLLMVHLSIIKHLRDCSLIFSEICIKLGVNEVKK